MTTEQLPELKPCPFAHKPEDVEQLDNPTPYATTSMNEDGYWQVVCPVCWVSTAAFALKENAVTQWSARADLSQPQRRQFPGETSQATHESKTSTLAPDSEADN